MCLAVPMQVEEINGRIGRVRSGGVEINAALDLIEDVAVGDYVIVHAGYAIQKLTSEAAHETLAILDRLDQS